MSADTDSSVKKESQVQKNLKNSNQIQMHQPYCVI